MLNKILIGDKPVQKAFLGNKEVKAILVGTKGVYAKPYTITVTVAAGYYKVNAHIQELGQTYSEGWKTEAKYGDWDGVYDDGQLIERTFTVQVGYGATVYIRGFIDKNHEYETNLLDIEAVKSDMWLEINATPTTGSVAINTVYLENGETEAYAAVTYQYSTNGTTWSLADNLIRSSVILSNIQKGSIVYIKDIQARPGFTFKTISGSGETAVSAVAGSPGVYQIKSTGLADKVTITCDASTSTTAIDGGWFNSGKANIITKIGRNVTINCKLEVSGNYPANTALGSIPAGYGPRVPIEYVIDWLYFYGGSSNDIKWDALYPVTNRNPDYANATAKLTLAPSSTGGTITSNIAGRSRYGENFGYGGANAYVTIGSYLILNINYTV